MRFNTKVRYGLRTMIEVASISDIGILQKNISKNQEISEKYLDHIVSSLKVAGLLKNVKGKKSGYKLSKKAEEIKVYDIFLAFESNLLGPDCIESDNACGRSERCSTKIFWRNFHMVMSEHLKSITLKDLVQHQLNINVNNKEGKMFYI